jgi:hypothetical protein
MPHDVKNQVLQVGDRVLIPAIIKELHAGEDYCNVTLETEHGRRPDGLKEQIYAINTGVLVKAD